MCSLKWRCLNICTSPPVLFISSPELTRICQSCQRTSAVGRKAECALLLVWWPAWRDRQRITVNLNNAERFKIMHLAFYFTICSPDKTLQLAEHNPPPPCQWAEPSSGSEGLFCTRQPRSSSQWAGTSQSVEQPQSHLADHYTSRPG